MSFLYFTLFLMGVSESLFDTIIIFKIVLSFEKLQYIYQLKLGLC